MAKRLVDGEWKRIGLGFGLRSRLLKAKHPTKRQYKKKVRKAERLSPKGERLEVLELMYDANGKPFMGRKI